MFWNYSLRLQQKPQKASQVTTGFCMKFCCQSIRISLLLQILQSKLNPIFYALVQVNVGLHANVVNRVIRQS